MLYNPSSKHLRFHHVYNKEYIIVYPKLEKPIGQKPEKTTQDKVIVILARGELNKSHGLPLFQGSDPVLLESRQILAAPLSKSQTFQGLGAGIGYMWI